MASFIKSAIAYKDYPDSEKEIVFVGRSNVGKSSLINALYGKNLAYTGKKAGKTRLLNFYETADYTFVDVPGYGFANRSEKELMQFGKMMEDYFSKRDSIKLCVVILDIRHLPSDDDLDMIAYLKAKNIPILYVFNKIDKLAYSKCLAQEKLLKDYLELNENEYILVSTINRKNIDVLKEKIITII